MQLLSVADLVPHPQNDYYFDDIAGEAWDEFLRSIQTSGVIEPIIINQNKMIISGHQRIRACKELGIKEVMTETKQYDSDEQMLKDLIETNIRQRGIGNPNPVKFGRCIQTLERIYGIQHGGDRKSKDNNCLLMDSPKTEQEFADTLGISLTSIKNYKQLAAMIPEIQDLINTGKVTATTARAIMKRLSEDEQRELADQLSEKDGKVSNKEIDFYINKVKILSDEKEQLVKEKESLKAQLQSPVTIEKLSDDDLNAIKAAIKEDDDKTENKLTGTLNSAYETIADLTRQVDVLQEDLLSRSNEITALKNERDSIKLQMETYRKEVQPTYDNCVTSDIVFDFCKKCVEFQNTVIAPIENGDSLTQCVNNNILYQRLYNTCKSMIDSLDRVIKKASITDVAIIDDEVVIDY